MAHATLLRRVKNGVSKTATIVAMIHSYR